MPLSPETVSAFASYSGLLGTLSKNQRRRKNKAKKNNISPPTSKSDKPHVMSKENIKKRKTEISSIKDDKIIKKQKMCNSVNKLLNEEQIKGNNTGPRKPSPVGKSAKLQSKSKPLNSSLTNGQLTNPTKVVVKKKLKGIMKDTVRVLQKKKKKTKMGIPLTIELLKDDDTKQKCERNAQKHNVKKVKFKLGTAKKKNNFKEVLIGDLQNETGQVEDELQRQLNGPAVSMTELVGVVNLNQENSPTLISKIKKIRKDLTSEKTNSQEMNPSEAIVHYQNKLLDKTRSSEDTGKTMFERIISPYDSTLFFKNYWEKTPLYIPGNPEKFSSLMSTQLIDDFLRQRVVMFGKHIDITSYNDGVRETHNPEGRALPHVVWDLYNNKCSVRLLCPQAAFNNVFIMNTKLQEYFGCFVGANAYLTPPNSQGFAPHYDDIEAFVLQIEGRKKWKIYNPRSKHETLPRFSSKNFTPSEVGNPILEVTLKPGDLLYFPRGFIHQADTSNASHSLHLTVSVYQKNCWVDLLEKALPLALSKAAKEEVDLRRGLPLHFLRHAGLAYNSQKMRKVLIKTLKQKMVTLLKYLDIDSAVDLMGIQFVTDALPPVLTPEEASRCTLGNGLRMESNGHVSGCVGFSGDTKVRFVTAHCCRLVKEKVESEDGTKEEQIRLYYTTDNSREYHGEEPQFLVIPEDYVPAIKMLSVNYPSFTTIASLPIASLDEQVTLVGDLWDRGILMTEEPLDEDEVIISGSSNATDQEHGIISRNEDIIEEDEESNEEGEDEGSSNEDNTSDIENNEMDSSKREYDNAICDIDKFVSDFQEIDDDSPDSDASTLPIENEDRTNIRDFDEVDLVSDDSS